MTMKFRIGTAILVTALCAAGGSGAPATGAAPRIEVCFVLDTTGSMGGLIEGAKLKIWSIANQLVSARPVPQLKVALLGYRDRGDEYVVNRYELSEDMDAVYANLQKFRAGGGGDTPESVNQALDEAVNRISWSADRSVLKIIFLVGDSPAHMDYQNDVQYPATCAAAVKRDLIINTVQCGANPETTRMWQDIANLAEGKSVAISQSGDMQIIATPVDAELSALNVAVGRTMTPYGTAAMRSVVMAKQAASEAAAAPAAADRLAYNTLTGQVVQGGGDLVDDVKNKKVALSGIRKDELPETMRTMTPEQQQAYLKAREAERRKIQTRIDELIKQRQAYIQDKTRPTTGMSSFDEQVRRIVTMQAKAKGIQYGADPSKK
jgi:hypothetical protein